MRILVAFVVATFLAACSGGEETSVAADAGVDARGDGASVVHFPDPDPDPASGIPCSAQVLAPSGPTYACGTCATDGVVLPLCQERWLVCPGKADLVRCECGALGLNTGCCDSCGTRAGSFICGASAKWECPAGLTPCDQTPKTCADAGSDAADSSSNAADSSSNAADSSSNAADSGSDPADSGFDAAD